MPYRIDISSPAGDALDRLLELGALDVERINDGIAAIIPDDVSPETVARAAGAASFALSPAIGRDNGSVWMLTRRDPPKGLRLIDSTAFGTGHHPSTALCIEAIEEAVAIEVPARILDVGTGSGVLALAALKMGVPRAVGLDLDAEALEVAAENAHLNQLSDRLTLVLGGPEMVEGIWPLAVANILASPLIEMAPALVRRVGHHGHLILSGIASSLESEVLESYQRLGMHHICSEARAGWTIVILQASW